MSESDRETLPDVREWWETLPDVREWSGGPGCPGVVGRPSRKFGSGWEALPNVRKWSRDSSRCPRGPPDVLEWSERPPKRPGVVGRPFQMSERPSQRLGCSRETLPDIRE